MPNNKKEKEKTVQTKNKMSMKNNSKPLLTTCKTNKCKLHTSTQNKRPRKEFHKTQKLFT